MQIDELNSPNTLSEDLILTHDEIEKFPKSFYTHAEAIFHLQEAGINQADFKLIKTSFIGIIVLPGAVFAAAFLKQQLIK